MRTVYISLPTGREVQAFVARLTGLQGGFDLVSGSYILDARSLMGIFSLNLSAPLRLDIELDTPENMAAVKPFMVSPPGHFEGAVTDGKKQ